MSVPSTDVDVEERIRAALKEKLPESGLLIRYHRHNDLVHLEVNAPIGLERTAKLVQQALDHIGPVLRSEKISLEVAVSSSWQPRWQQPATVSGD
jgi:hypothetical protein